MHRTKSPDPRHADHTATPRRSTATESTRPGPWGPIAPPVSRASTVCQTGAGSRDGKIQRYPICMGCLRMTRFRAAWVQNSWVLDWRVRLYSQTVEDTLDALATTWKTHSWTVVLALLASCDARLHNAT